MQSRIFTFQRRPRLLLNLFVFHCHPYRNGNRVNSHLDYFRTNDMTWFKRVWLDNFVRFDRFSAVVSAILSFSFPIISVLPSVGSFPHLILRHFSSFFPSSLATSRVLFKIFEHNIFMASCTRFGSSPTRFYMLVKLAAWPVILTVFAHSRLSWTFIRMLFQQLRLEHFLAQRAFLFFMKFFLSKISNTL